MKNGIYYNLREEEYRQAAGVSKHALDNIEHSPARYLHCLANPKKPTDSMMFGSYIHALILEPELASEQYAIAPKCDKRTKEGKSLWENFEAQNIGKKYISYDDADTAERIHDAIRKHTEASELLFKTKGKNEVCMFSDDNPLQIKRKGKADRITDNIIIDLKTTKDASAREFRKSVFSFSYHVQASYYIDLYRECVPDCLFPKFKFIVVEDKEPYSVAIHELDADFLANGRERYWKNLAILHECMKSGVYPDVQGEVIKFSYDKV